MTHGSFVAERPEHASVGGRNLWLWYRFTDEELVLVTVTTDPPVPVEES